MLNAFLTVQALYVAADLGLADLLARGPKTAEELAESTKADATSLNRLLRMLTGPGVFELEADGTFALTALGSTLKSEGADSVRDWALFVGAPEMWEVWAGLHESVLTGRASFPVVHGMPMWEYIAGHPKLGRAFNGWMTRQSEQHNAALVAAYDFSRFRRVVDIGGGRGRRWPPSSALTPRFEASCSIFPRSSPVRPRFKPWVWRTGARWSAATCCEQYPPVAMPTSSSGS